MLCYAAAAIQCACQFYALLLLQRDDVSLLCCRRRQFLRPLDGFALRHCHTAAIREARARLLMLLLPRHAPSHADMICRCDTLRYAIAPDTL